MGRRCRKGQLGVAAPAYKIVIKQQWLGERYMFTDKARAVSLVAIGLSFVLGATR